MRFLRSFSVFSLLPVAFAGLYYPPILSPKNGDIIPVGSNFTVVWNTTIPEGIRPDQVAKVTSEVRVGIYFPPTSKQPNGFAYQQFPIYELNPSPNPNPDWNQPLYFYKEKLPDYTDSGLGWAQFQLDKHLCTSDDLVIAWWDAQDPQVFSGVFHIVGDCWTG
ncbi:hypothetical protein B0O99DRAFT_293531 [Bisporella sp. PMI_857]|nr:hypothetical protein B0O99DRAFT_293531 [Bisporella sp. PMI_857]